jgi:DNA-directed RNA polymerase subunit N (RpoN/RPB10)
MEAVRCLDCGSPLGMYYDAFKYRKEQYTQIHDTSTTEVHVDKKFLMTSTLVLIPVFEALNVKKYCCRNSLTSGRSMDDIGF